MFVVYLVLLTWLILWKFEVPYTHANSRVVKLVPFIATPPRFGSSQAAEVVANFLLFVPFGSYLGLLAPSWRWWKSAGVIAAASIGLEIVEYVLAVGRTDVTDVIVNTTGGMVGLGLLALLRRGLRDRTSRVMARVLATLTVLALLAVGLFLASPLHFGPPRDGGDRLPALSQAHPDAP